MSPYDPSFNNILVTGHLGYIGSVLTPILSEKGYRVTGLDTEYYGDVCAFYNAPSRIVNHLDKDIRDVEEVDFEGIDAVIHLAALSNDPLGELSPGITHEINYLGAMRVGECARKAGVKRFVYVSSQSMYGISDVDGELDEDKSLKNPLTAYAKAKWQAECDLNNLNDDDFSVVSFRPSTVFGKSPKLRCDIVFNNLVGCAFTKGHIEIRSDGTPWRPVIHVIDVVDALIAGLEAPDHLIKGQAFNIGIKNGNYTVKQLARAASAVIPGTPLTFTGEHGSDSRTYRVSFRKILTVLQSYFSPRRTLDEGGRELLHMFKSTGFTESDFTGIRTNRLKMLKQLLESGQLDPSFKWKRTQ